MTTTAIPSRRLREGDFAQDSHAAKYRGEFDAHPEAMRQLIHVLNEPANEQRLLDAEAHGMPALAGIVRQVEGDPSIETVLKAGTKGYRFRQTVGVAITLKMSRLGWKATGRKGTVKNARYFTKAEHYESDRPPAADAKQRALAALDAIEHIGDDDERAETGHMLMDALNSTRREEGRPF
ncbi:MAG: hypothetical protein HYX32_00465 [Actinobacteria bacterium]|nr:hypothetical protein [Actinomycetota bacterium]